MSIFELCSTFFFLKIFHKLFFCIWQRKIYFFFSLNAYWDQIIDTQSIFRHFKIFYDVLKGKKKFSHMHCAFFFNAVLQKCFKIIIKNHCLMNVSTKIYIIAFLHNSTKQQEQKKKMRINCGQCVWTFSTWYSQLQSLIVGF